jgi:hypothetical protein
MSWRCTNSQWSWDSLLSAILLQIILVHFMFAVNAENYDPYGIWTSLKMVLLQPFKKLTALNINNFHSPTIRCPLNVNRLLHK